MKVVETRVMSAPFWPAGPMDHMCQCLIDFKDDPKACSFTFAEGFDRERWARDAAVQIAVAYEDTSLVELAAETVIPEMLKAIDKYLEDEYLVCHECAPDGLGTVTPLLPASYQKENKENKMLPEKLCEEGGHDWSIFKISHVSKPGEYEFKEREVNSTPHDISICDKCGMVCYHHKTIGLVNTMPFMFVDEKKWAEMEAK